MSQSGDTPGVPLDDRSVSILEDFTRAWESSRPDVAAYWERHPTRPPRLLWELAAIDLAQRLERGERATADEYESRFPILATDATLSGELRRMAEHIAARLAHDPHATVPPTRSPAPEPPVGAGAGIPSDGIASRATSDSLLGSVIGGVSIVRIIADGGMGRVYEGRQDKPRRPVAVKVIKPGIASPNMLKRFEYEAQVLGRLRHPGIAQIYSAGTHEVRGQEVPYFVMEYIPNAKSLTQYANDQKLSTQERLELFRKVCEAVAHGHQKGVIHRDLKPGNVLVDSSGQPKVIDFGVARSTDSDMALTTMQTDVGALIGTLQYMSPEQFDADPSDLDVRLDVYALGVILYELLTGKPPFEVKQRAIIEVARVVREEEPTPLSSINKTLRRDVAVIAATCLQKDRNRRYSSAAELAGDVSRYLAGEPIAAAPPSFWDALVRMARRHKAAATAVAAIAASLVAAVVGISAFALRAERAREEADAQRAVADRERDNAIRASEAEAEQRQVAERARAVADAESMRAKKRLYMSMLYRLRMTLDDVQSRRLAYDTFEETESAYRDAYGSQGTRPIELGILKPSLDRSLAVFEGHKSDVKYLAFSPDGTRLATASDDNTACVWDAATGESLAVLEGHKDGVTFLAFSPDGTRLATLSKDNTARLWNAATGQSLAVLVGHGGLAFLDVFKLEFGGKDNVSALAFSPDGTRLATASNDSPARLWDTATGKSLAVLEGHKSGIEYLAFSPDGSRLATGSEDNTARLWNAATGEALAVLEGHTSGVTFLAFSPDGTRLATGSRDSTVRLWDTATGESIAVLEGHKGGVTSLAFSPDGTRLATGSRDNTARLWCPATGEPLAVLFGHEASVLSFLFVFVKGRVDGVSALAFSPDGTRLATGSEDNTARLWDAATGEPLAVLEGHKDGVTSLAFSPDGTRLTTGSQDSTARLWDAAPDESIAVLKGHTDSVSSLAFSSDGMRLATGSEDNTTRLWDAATGESLAVLEGHKNGVTSLAFSPDGTRLATGSEDNTARLWDAATGKSLVVLEGHGNAVAFSPDGSRLAAASKDNTARLWDAATGEPVAVLEGHKRSVYCLAFSPVGTRVATGSADNTARLWDAATGESLTVLEGHKRSVECLAFSPDGTRVATGSADNTARLWDAATGESLAVLEGHEQLVDSLAFSPDGTRLATVSWEENTVFLWNTATAESIAVLKGHTIGVHSLAFSPDGARLATGSWDNSARLWDATTGELIDVIKGYRSGSESPPFFLAFSPDGTLLATGSDDNTVRLRGASNAEIYRNRLASAAACERVAPVVDAWFATDPAAVKAKLSAAKATMPPDDWRAAANMVLQRFARP